MHGITEKTLSLVLDLPEFIAPHFKFESLGKQRILHLCCEHAYGLALCPHCREVSKASHDSRSRCVRDLDFGPWQAFIGFISRRFDCDSCGWLFSERLASVDPRRRQTRRFEQYISALPEQHAQGRG